MTRVGVVIEALGRGGAERLLVDTARLIDRSRFELHVFTLFDVRRDYAEALASLGVQEQCLGLSGPRQLVRGARRLRALLAARPVDIVHTHLFCANVVGRLAARLERTPVVSSYHDADYEPVVRKGNPRLTPAKQQLYRVVDRVTATFSRCHAVAVSEYVARSLQGRLGFSPRRITVIPNAVDTAVFRPDERLRDESRRGLGLAAGELMVLCVGRMTPQKGQDTLIRAFSFSALSGARLVLAGGGGQQASLEELSRDLGVADRVRFLGTRTDVPDLMRAADLLALPSLHEGFGLVVAEGLASGIPVVANRVGPVPEILREGETGVLVEAGDPGALAAALADLLRAPGRREWMGQRGRLDALARFDLRQMVDRLEALYLKLASR